MHKRFFILIALFIAVGAWLTMQATSDSVAQVKTPSDLQALGTETTVQRLRIAGRVAPREVLYHVEPSMLLTFSVVDPGTPPELASTKAAIPVRYEGIKPDMFAVGRDVILDGEYVQGTFVASKLLTQCPSKYEPPKPPGARPETSPSETTTR